MKAVASVLFLILFIPFLVISTLRFEILNQKFLFWSLDRNNVYSQLPQKLAESLTNDPKLSISEKKVYADIIKNISTRDIKTIVETNLASILGFINGESDDLLISISASSLGIKGKNINWSLKNDVSPGAILSIQKFSGIGSWLLVVIGVLFFILLFITLYAGKRTLLIGGIVSLFLGVVGKAFLLVVIANTPAREPSQILLLVSSTSILSDIVLSWMVLGGLLIISWILLKIVKRKSNKVKN